MIDPNTLLNNIRSAIASDHRAVALMAFATLDKQLIEGGDLPDDWRQPYREQKRVFDSLVAQLRDQQSLEDAVSQIRILCEDDGCPGINTVRSRTLLAILERHGL
jgi:hypothetical protein